MIIRYKNFFNKHLPYSKLKRQIVFFQQHHRMIRLLGLAVSLRNIEAVKEFYASDAFAGEDRSGTAGEERRQVFGVLDEYGRLPFEGAVLSTPEDGIVAFTIGVSLPATCAMAVAL